MKDKDQLWMIDDCAEFLRCSTKTVSRMVQRGDFPHLYIGRALRFRPEAVKEWTREQEATSPNSLKAAVDELRMARVEERILSRSIEHRGKRSRRWS